MSKLMEKFDDVTKDEQGRWSQICEGCRVLLAVPDYLVDENSGHGICGVEGCNTEADHYIDFK